MLFLKKAYQKTSIIFLQYQIYAFYGFNNNIIYYYNKNE